MRERETERETETEREIERESYECLKNITVLVSETNFQYFLELSVIQHILFLACPTKSA